MYFCGTCFVTITMIFGLGLIVNGGKVCDRIYVSTGDESKMPYVQLQGVYRKINESNGRPMFQHEQRQIYHLEYSKGDNGLYFSWKGSKGIRHGFGVKAVMTNGFASQNWVNSITDERRPFEKFIKQWAYYDWQAKSYVVIGRGTVQLTCARNDFYRCSSGKVYYNTTFDDGRGTILHNHLEDSFVEESDGGSSDYNNNRKMYRHSRQKHWILFYESSYWKVANDTFGYRRPFLRARDSSMRPEYITAVWERLRGSTWKPFSTSKRCRGFVQKVVNGTTKTCSNFDPCKNGGQCVDSKLSIETVCVCAEDYIGNTCTTKQQTCPIYRYDRKSVATVIQFGLQASNLATVFCKDGYQPKFFLSQCVEGGYSNVWTSDGKCGPTLFNFNDYPKARPVLLTIVSLLQVVVPLIHMWIALCNEKSGCRVLSLHAFISYICWWLYLIGCTSTKCAKHGKVLGDFTIMSIVMISFSYLLMLIESCFSSEEEYISSTLDGSSAIEFVNLIKNTDPKRVMSVVCYHWETKTKTVDHRDFQGNITRRKEAYREKVITYRENKNFPIGYAKDVSNEKSLKFDKYGVTRLRLTQDIKFGDRETFAKFDDMGRKMVALNMRKDEHIEFYHEDRIDGFQKRICAYTDPKFRPFWMTSGYYWVASLIGLSWIFRIMFNCKTKRCEYTIRKLMYLRPPSEDRELTGPAGSLDNPAPQTNIEIDARSTEQPAQEEPYSLHPLEIVPMLSTQVPCEPPPDYNSTMTHSTNA